MLQLLQLLQPIQRFMQRLILLRKMEADQVVHILAEEAGAGHCAYAHIPGQHLAEFQVALVAVAGNVHQHVVRALGRGVLQPDGIQALHKQIPLVGVGFQQFIVLVPAKAQAGDDSLLQGRGGAYGQKVVDLIVITCLYCNLPLINTPAALQNALKRFSLHRCKAKEIFASRGNTAIKS